MSGDNIEDSIKKGLDESELDVATLQENLQSLQEHGHSDKAEVYAEKLLKALDRKDMQDQILPVLEQWIGWHAGDRSWKQKVADRLTEFLKESRHTQAMVDASGFEQIMLRPSECYARFKVLYTLKEGDYVFERTWGFGTVAALLFAEGKIEVDFERKMGHQMALGYAAESLQIVDENHLYAKRSLKPEEFAEMLTKEQPEVVRTLLRSFGPKSAPIIQEMLVPEFLPEDNWKKFWDAARKGLKKDPLVVIPTKRSEPIVLLAKEKAYDDEWFAGLKAERDMTAIIAELNEFLAEADSIELNEANREVVVNRLSFVVTGAEGKHDDLMVKTLLTAAQLHLDPGEVGCSPFIERLTHADEFLAVVSSLQSKEVKGLFEHLPQINEEQSSKILEAALPGLQYTALNEAINQLIGADFEDQVAAAIRNPWSQWEAGVDIMYWLATNMEKVQDWKLGGVNDLLSRCLKVVAQEHTGERLRVRNQLRELFRNPEWLKKVTDPLDGRQRKNFAQAVRDSTAWDGLDHGSVKGNLVKVCPELEDIISGKTSEQAAEVVSSRPRITSVRSFTERAALLKRIKEKDIPENSRDIGAARELGDLRENFEFKAAKERQALLSARAAELEEALDTVQHNDFSNMQSEVVDVATHVQIKYANGEEAAYNILGEWDNEEELNIISSGTQLAKALLGKRAGETAAVPSAEGETQAEVMAVAALSPEILAWANTEVTEYTKD